MKKLFILVIIIAAVGCSKRSGLSDSVFIPDSVYTDLPAYSEWGYNTFGANYDRSVFIYSRNVMPLKVIVQNQDLSFVFQGVIGNYSGNYLSMKITIPDTATAKYQDLLDLNDTRINLSGSEVVVEFIIDQNSKVIEILEGELYFKRTQKIFVDDVEAEVILSGYFNLKFIEEGIPFTMTDGRFDFGVDNDNFYNLN